MDDPNSDSAPLDDSTGSGEGSPEDKQRIVNRYVRGIPAEKEIRQRANYAGETVLTVWRFLHLESDLMVALPMGANRISAALRGRDCCPWRRRRRGHARCYR